MDYLSKINAFIQLKSDFFWDSGFSFTLENLDNPAWRLTISNDEKLGQLMTIKQHWESDDNWLHITADNHKFEGIGGCKALDELCRFSFIWLNIVD